MQFKLMSFKGQLHFGLVVGGECSAREDGQASSMEEDERRGSRGTRLALGGGGDNGRNLEFLEIFRKKIHSVWLLSSLERG